MKVLNILIVLRKMNSRIIIRYIYIYIFDAQSSFENEKDYYDIETLNRTK